MNGNLPTYTFLPWIRQGMSKHIETVDPLGAPSAVTERAEVDVRLRVNDRPHLSKNIKLIGPGDIIGINPRAIIKSEPRNWITDFEANYLPFIEFYFEDFAWRYTPAKATGEHRLRPWIFLIALTEAEFELSQTGGPLPRIVLKGAVDRLVPRPEQTWAWAHVHVSKDITNESSHAPGEAVDELESLIKQNPDEACCRLLAPRKLQPNTAYHAFVIPTFEAGRLAGLGQSTEGVDALKPAWGDGQSEFPVYYQWYFRTGERGDFEYLANLLEPRPVDERVGIRDMDMQRPEYEVTGLTGELATMGLEGALKSPQAVSRPENWPPEPMPAFLQELQQKVNLQHEAKRAGHPDPIISPPLYGRWHAKVETLEIANPETAPALLGWVHQLNGDPRNRVPSGFGTKVIQENQEDFKQRAWKQLGEVLRANQKIRLFQLSLSTAFRMFKKNILPLAADRLISVTQPLHGRVLGSPTTVLQKLRESRVTSAAVNPAFRKITRPRGVLIKKAITSENGRASNLLVQINDGSVRLSPPKLVPDDQIFVNELAEQTIPDWIPQWLRRLAENRTARNILIGLLLLLLLIGVFAGFSPLLIIGIVVAGAALGVLEFVRRQLTQAEALREDNLTTETVRRTPVRSDFVITNPGEAVPGDRIAESGTDSPEAANFRQALLDMHVTLETPIPKPAPRPALNFNATAQAIVQSINPVHVLPKRALTVVAIPPSFKFVRPVDTIAPVMAHPIFPDPMYRPLRDISAESLIPNLHLIPNNTVSLLETNRPFIESYMMGCNHEMSRELLWIKYPTDQRGTYFRQFWEAAEIVNRDPEKSIKEREEEQRDITPIHTWGRTTNLGSHENRDLPTGAEPGEARLVLVIKGDLLKKYPTTMIYAQKAKWGKDEHDRDVRILDDSDPVTNLQEPIFKAEIEPDLKFLGLNLTMSAVRGSQNIEDDNAGWFFVFQEPPGEPRFGLDVPAEDTPEVATEWNDLAWSHLGDEESLNYIDVEAEISANIPEAPDNPDSRVHWGANAADQAYILYQVPVMVAFHAGDMLA